MNDMKIKIEEIIKNEFGEGYSVMPLEEFGRQRVKKLRTEGLNAENTLVVTSVCRDDIMHIANPFSDYFRKYKHGFFMLGGLMGFPAGGIKAMMAASHHVPHSEQKNIVIIYGPHIGVTESGEMGKVLRRGQHHESAACGAMVGFLNAYREASEAGKTYSAAKEHLNAEIAHVENKLLPYMRDALKAEKPLIALTKIAYDMIDDEIIHILEKAKGEMHGAQIKAIGAIFVNGPGRKDYVCVKERKKEI